MKAQLYTLNQQSTDPENKGYYLLKTIENKYGIAYFDGKDFLNDPNQDGKIEHRIARGIIKKWYELPQ